MNRFTKSIPFSRPSVGREEIRAVKRVLKSGWLTTGPENIEFEKEFASMIQVPYALSVNSATAGLHLALEALNIGPGDKVIVPAYTFTASAEIVSYCGAEILLADINEDYNISPEAVKGLIETHPQSVKAVILVHLAGKSCDIQSIEAICSRKGIPIIEDCAHAFPVQTPAGYLGTQGRIGVFSFYANKTITTGEGGMVVTSDKDLCQRMKLMRLHGIDRDIWNRYTESKGKNTREYDVTAAGFKYNLTNFQAAIGRIQLRKAELLKAKRTVIAQRYNQYLQSSSLITLPPSDKSHAWHLYILQCKDQQSRDSLEKYLYQHHIGTSLHFIPLPCFTYYQNSLKISPEDYPHSLHKYQTSLSIPIFPDLKRKNQMKIIRVIQDWEQHYG